MRDINFVRNFNVFGDLRALLAVGKSEEAPHEISSRLLDQFHPENVMFALFKGVKFCARYVIPDISCSVDGATQDQEGEIWSLYEKKYTWPRRFQKVVDRAYIGTQTAVVGERYTFIFRFGNNKNIRRSKIRMKG